MEVGEINEDTRKAVNALVNVQKPTWKNEFEKKIPLTERF